MYDLLAFVEQYLAVPNTGDTPENKGQCVGLIEVWLDANKLPHIWGNAKDLMTNATTQFYRVIGNGPTNYPLPGAIVCWDETWGAGAGHTAVVLAANSMHLVVFEQNDPTGSPPLVATHTYQGVLGWITF